ncbi:GT2 family glycosyltransferase [Flavobacterium cutihirudinis]|uniref:GT2 family glycosyltransferase n=1 Tax=Flavobacterium cutihirudinis TaxID=1265740 RepID=A0A3D9G118_9FLAO|nr:glycosyltransferase [Flavobacterium cutihirudinis]RED26272.1 GT2 family glycosyltransferase [Flavobacterium cutihirudinis]
MLSVLIPVYNYNVYPLVSEIKQQADNLGIEYEIICYDDASDLVIEENHKISQFQECSFIVLKKNVGRSAIRNLLAEKAMYENLLLLDADVIPTNNQFVSNYITAIKKNQKVVFGGQLYKDDKPAKELLLRWIYGKKRESQNLAERSKNHYDFALVSNLLIKKEILIGFPFDETLTKYGYEDLLFFTILKSNGIKITHIENPIFHLNCETSKIFLTKTKVALENLVFLNIANKISKDQSKIITSFDFLRRLKLISFFVFIFKKSEQKIRLNLLSEKPSLFLFDIYKLGYYCFLKTK